MEVRSKSTRKPDQECQNVEDSQENKLTLSRDVNRRKSKDEMISEMMKLFEDAKVFPFLCTCRAPPFHLTSVHVVEFGEHNRSQ